VVSCTLFHSKPSHSLRHFRERDIALERAHLIPAYDINAPTVDGFVLKFKGYEQDPRPNTLIFKERERKCQFVFVVIGKLSSSQVQKCSCFSKPLLDTKLPTTCLSSKPQNFQNMKFANAPLGRVLSLHASNPISSAVQPLRTSGEFKFGTCPRAKTPCRACYQA
jgi:hypothetical protein